MPGVTNPLCRTFPRVGEIYCASNPVSPHLNELSATFLVLTYVHLSQNICCMISAASCNYWRFGSGGRQENINAICILRLNIINDKVRSRIIFCVFKGIFKYCCQTILCLTVWPGVPGTVVVVCPHITAGGPAVALQGGPGEPHLFRPVASLSPCRCRAPACGTSCWRSGSAGGRGGGTHKSNKTNIAAKSAGN